MIVVEMRMREKKLSYMKYNKIRMIIDIDDIFRL
jgi:hypothetical protein